MSCETTKPINIVDWNTAKSKPINIPSGVGLHKYANLKKHSKDFWVKIQDVSCDLYQGIVCKTPENESYSKGDRFIFHKEHIHSLRHTLVSPK